MSAPDPHGGAPLPIEGPYAIINADDLTATAAVDRIEALVRGGVCALQLRFKAATSHQRQTVTAAVGPRAAHLKIPLIINDDVELASADIEGIWGLHVGQEDLDAIASDPGAAVSALRQRLDPRMRGLGLSTHDLDQVRAAVALAPDYIGFGPVFATRSKADAAAVTGLDALRLACDLFPGPVVAIGGVNASRLSAVRRAGARSVAAISALAGPDAAACERAASVLSRSWNEASSEDSASYRRDD